MSEMQPVSSQAAMPAVLVAPSFEDYDIALGCECAYPSLQIERWGQEAREGTGEAN